MSDRVVHFQETDRFKIEDLFFSRTDERGVIATGNETFRFVSDYSWEELIGAPHKVIRHKGTPKGVFHLAWERLQEGYPIGAYVVNKSKDGLAYWVYAVMSPIDGGYLSVRLKPSSEYLEMAKELYAELCEEEAEGTLTPAESSLKMRGKIRDMGHNTYRAFMTAALSAELRGRNDAMSRGPMRKIAALERIANAVRQIEKDSSMVSDLFDKTVQIPYNMRLQAGRLEGSDGPISVLSTNHQQMTQSFALAVKEFREAASLGEQPVRDGIFVSATTSLFEEILGDYETESGGIDEESKSQDLRYINELRDRYADQTKRSVADVATGARNFARMCKDMRRLLSGLELTRIMCKIERSKATGNTEGLDEIVNRLYESERDLSEVMTRIDEAVQDIIEATDQLLKPPAKKAA